jgi:hypothetical protein
MNAKRGVVTGALRILLSTAGAAACSSEQTCEVDVLARESLEGVAARDCGDPVAQGDEHPELQAAHDCVEQALEAPESFLILWTYSGFEGDVTSAYVGRVEERRWTLEHYQRAPDGVGNQSTSRRRCGDLAPMTTCDASLLRGFLCFECEEPSAPDVFCAPDS